MMKIEYVIASLVAGVFILNFLTTSPVYAGTYTTCTTVGTLTVCTTTGSGDYEINK